MCGSRSRAAEVTFYHPLPKLYLLYPTIPLQLYLTVSHRLKNEIWPKIHPPQGREGGLVKWFLGGGSALLAKRFAFHAFSLR